MLDTSSAEKVAAIMDQFSVPMFAVERASFEDDFKILCVNHALSHASGFAVDAVRNVAVRDLLSADEAELVVGHYSECARTRRTMRFLETLTLPDGVRQWDTTLQHIALASGADRVVGTMLPMTVQAQTEDAKMTYDNVRYFSALADMQIKNLLAMFEIARDQGLFSSNSTGRINRLCSVCRSVQRSVEDIRETVRHADRSAPDTPGESSLGQRTLRALYSTALADQ